MKSSYLFLFLFLILPTLLSAQEGTKIRFENASDDIRLFGELSEPDTGYQTIVILVSDSGKDRYKMHPDLTDSLLAAGFAVFRYDERGVGKSKGNFAAATTADFASDLSAAVRYFQEEVPYATKSIAIIGFGEGGTSALVAANDGPRPERLVLIGTPAMSGERVLFAQTETSLFDQLRVGDFSPQDTRTHLIRIHTEMRKEVPERAIEQNVRDYIADNGLDAAPGRFLHPHYRFYVNFDPTRILRTLRMPMLFLYGSEDIYVQPPQNSKQIWKTGNQLLTYETLDGLDHHLRRPDTESIARKAVARIIDYLR